MICVRCRDFTATSGSTLCHRCADTPPPAPPHEAPPYAGAPHGAWLRSPAVLGRATAALLGLVVVADLFAVLADRTTEAVAGDLADGLGGADVAHRIDRADMLYSAAGVAQTITMLATMAVYLCWLWRVRVNAEVFDASRHSLKRGWAIAGWFCPVVNLWFPRRIVLDSWDASAPRDGWAGHVVVNAWWATWLVSLVAGRFASSRSERAGTAADMRDAARLMLVGDSLDIAGAVLCAVVVLKLTAMQGRKVLEGPPPSPVLG
ncbi:DUF4328 domain-containing protein [Streptomyces sp. NPDC048514]|uniref:DUF4328 domain-containing protein n=1 Tax=Streptomyces sp. NPDC048514 TaxID=3365564 RepID=UPI00370F8531